MSMVSARDASIEVASMRVLGAHLRGWVLVPLLVVVVLAVGCAVYLARQPTGAVAHRALTGTERLSPQRQ